jgi:hypothetical protein
MMSESEYKEMMALKGMLMRTEDTETKEREIANLRTMLMTKLLGIESRMQDLTDLKGVYEEVLEGL